MSISKNNDKTPVISTRTTRITTGRNNKKNNNNIKKSNNQKTQRENRPAERLAKSTNDPDDRVGTTAKSPLASTEIDLNNT
jgi:hypothetical protein